MKETFFGGSKEESVCGAYSKCDVDSVSCVCLALHYGRVVVVCNTLVDKSLSGHVRNNL